MQDKDAGMMGGIDPDAYDRADTSDWQCCQ
ncbi:hypothetical protein M2318_004942 [Metapseudomonas resinovorans]